MSKSKGPGHRDPQMSDRAFFWYCTAALFVMALLTLVFTK
jgi:hypothetical protein